MIMQANLAFSFAAQFCNVQSSQGWRWSQRRARQTSCRIWKWTEKCKSDFYWRWAIYHPTDDPNSILFTVFNWGHFILLFLEIDWSSGTVYIARSPMELYIKNPQTTWSQPEISHPQKITGIKISYQKIQDINTSKYCISIFSRSVRTHMLLKKVEMNSFLIHWSLQKFHFEVCKPEKICQFFKTWKIVFTLKKT